MMFQENVILWNYEAALIVSMMLYGCLNQL